MNGPIAKLASSGRSCRIGEKVGEGGQGSVFEAWIDDEPERYALKWYFPRTATESQWQTLFNLIELGSPHPRFIWPLDVVTIEGQRTFGYLMPFRPDEFVGLSAVMRGEVNIGLRQTATIGLQLAESFLFLHSLGLSYRDINFGNIFIRPIDGEILICDNDNVGVAGDPGFGVLGAEYFMAPEIWRGEALPSTSTDLFSLAVMLFYVLVVDHPLIGARRNAFPGYDDLKANEQMFGQSPVFIFDPDDPSNRPEPGVQDNALSLWPLYPQFIRDLFTTAFTRGLRDSAQDRVGEARWRSAMLQLRDTLVYCQSCHMENCFDPVGPAVQCWKCQSKVELPYKLVLANREVMLNHDTAIYRHHFRRDYRLDEVVAEVTRHPQHVNLWGLRNLTTHSWTVTYPDGTYAEVAPGRSGRLLEGALFNFGPAQGRIAEGDERIGFATSP